VFSYVLLPLGRGSTFAIVPVVCEIREKEDAWVENFNPPPRRARSDVYLLAALRTQIRNNLRNWTRLGPFAVLDGSSGALGDKIFN
jgi:hypothetical protein